MLLTTVATARRSVGGIT